MDRMTQTQTRSFLACVEQAHPFRLLTEVSTTTIRKRTAWLLNERETGIANGADVSDPSWLTALDSLISFYADMLPTEPATVLQSFRS